MNSASTTRWRLRNGSAGFRLDRVRALGSEAFTWADLLSAGLSTVDVFVLYFPSRFELPVDVAVASALETFGRNTSRTTSVNFWDPRDEHFSEALALFSVRNPPALVLVTGLLGATAGPTATDELYSIAFSGDDVLMDRANTAAAVNVAHEILVRCDRREITNYIRHRKGRDIVNHVGKAAGVVRDEFLKLRPKFGLPGGASFQLG